MADEPKTPEKYAEEIAKYIVERVDSHTTAASTHLDNFEKFNKMWECVPDERKGRQRKKGGERMSNTYVPELHQNTEAVVSAVMAHLFGDPDWLELDPPDISPRTMARIYLTQAVLMKQFEEMDLESKLEPIIRDIIRDGTGIAELVWAKKTHYEARPGEDGQRVPKEVVDYEGPDVMQVEKTGFHFMPTALSMDDTPWACKIERVPKESVERLVRAAKNETMPTSDAADREDAIRQVQGWITTEKDGLVEIIDYCGRHPHPDKAASPVMWRIVIVNRKYAVVEMPSPYWHGQSVYLAASCVQRNRSFYGLGIGHITWRKQVEINDRRNLALDILVMQLYNMWLSKGGDDDEIDGSKMYPGKVWKNTGQMEAFRPPIEALPVAMQMEAADKSEVRYATGATEAALGMPTDTTATEFKGMAMSTGKRLMAISKRISRQLLKPLVKRILSMDEQYMTDPIVVRLFGKDIQVDPSMLMWSARPRVRLSSDVDFRGAMARRLTAALETGLKLKQAGVDWNLDALGAKLARLLGINPADLVPSEANLGGAEKDIKRQLAEAELMQMLGAGGAPPMPGAPPQGGQGPVAPPVPGQAPAMPPAMIPQMMARPGGVA